MEYVYAAMLIHSAGNEISEDTVTDVLEAAGVEADDSRVKALLAALEGVEIDEAMSQAAAAPAAAAAAPSGESAPAEAAEEEAAEEEAEEEEEEGDEEEAAEGLGSLFG